MNKNNQSININNNISQCNTFNNIRNNQLNNNNQINEYVPIKDHILFNNNPSNINNFINSYMQTYNKLYFPEYNQFPLSSTFNNNFLTQLNNMFPNFPVSLNIWEK